MKKLIFTLTAVFFMNFASADTSHKQIDIDVVAYTVCSDYANYVAAIAVLEYGVDYYTAYFYTYAKCLSY